MTDIPGLPSFDVGLGGDADLPGGGGVLVLGLDSGVRGILGRDTNAFSYSGLQRDKQQMPKSVYM